MMQFSIYQGINKDTSLLAAPMQRIAYKYAFDTKVLKGF